MKMDLTSSPCCPKRYVSHIFTPLLEILLAQSFLGRCSLPWLSLQALCAHTNAYQYLISISRSDKPLCLSVSFDYQHDFQSNSVV